MHHDDPTAIQSDEDTDEENKTASIADQFLGLDQLERFQWGETGNPGDSIDPPNSERDQPQSTEAASIELNHQPLDDFLKSIIDDNQLSQEQELDHLALFISFIDQQQSLDAIVNGLVSFPFDINLHHPNYSLATALHYASFRGREDVVKFLLKQPSINAALVDQSILTPLQIAQGQLRLVLSSRPFFEQEASVDKYQDIIKALTNHLGLEQSVPNQRSIFQPIPIISENQIALQGKYKNISQHNLNLTGFFNDFPSHFSSDQKKVIFNINTGNKEIDKKLAEHSAEKMRGKLRSSHQQNTYKAGRDVASNPVIISIEKANSSFIEGEWENLKSLLEIKYGGTVKPQPSTSIPNTFSFMVDMGKPQPKRKSPAKGKEDETTQQQTQRRKGQ